MNWTQQPYPVTPWDTAGLPPRTMGERCSRHKHCAYRDDDPARCPLCHSSRCDGSHGGAPSDGSWRLGKLATTINATLKPDQPIHPGVSRSRRTSWPQSPECVLVLA
jgi:hypothetical protein